MADLFNLSWDSLDLAGVGAQSDGTYGVPSSAQPYNAPSGTAGYSAASDPSAYEVLKWGAGVAADLFKFDSMLDYKRFEATNGGVFQQGQSAAVRSSTGGIDSRLVLAVVAVVGFLLLTGKRA